MTIDKEKSRLWPNRTFRMQGPRGLHSGTTGMEIEMPISHKMRRRRRPRIKLRKQTIRCKMVSSSLKSLFKLLASREMHPKKKINGIKWKRWQLKKDMTEPNNNSMTCWLISLMTHRSTLKSSILDAIDSEAIFFNISSREIPMCQMVTYLMLMIKCRNSKTSSEKLRKR